VLDLGDVRVHLPPPPSVSLRAGYYQDTGRCQEAIKT
jgi:hypothetical protein